MNFVDMVLKPFHVQFAHNANDVGDFVVCYRCPCAIKRISGCFWKHLLNIYDKSFLLKLFKCEKHWFMTN